MYTVFIDIDTQLDFLYPAGALYVPKAERIVCRIAQLNRFAALTGIPVVSTTDAHTEDDPEFKVWPPHCVVGTWGQRKPEATLLEKRVVVPNRAELPDLSGAKQIIIEKQTVDALQAPNFLRVLDHLGADRCAVYGVVTEVCVLHAVRGLLRSGRKVTVITDAIETLKLEDSARALEEMRGGGAAFQETASIAG
jgi:nicotinamidase/pyrazinamidase